MEMFCEDTPTIPEVIVANTLNLKPDFLLLARYVPNVAKRSI